MKRRAFIQCLFSTLFLPFTAVAPRRQIEPMPTLYSDSEGTVITTELSDNNLATGVEYAA